MRTYTASVTRKGQLTLPAEVRQTMQLEIPGKVSIVIDDDRITIARAEWTLDDVFGSTKPLPAGATADLDAEIDEIIVSSIEGELLQ